MSGTRTINVVVHLKKGLYGLWQAGFNWYNTPVTSNERTGNGEF